VRIWTDRGRITIELDHLSGSKLAFDVFADGFAIAAWLDSTGKVIRYVEVGKA